MFTRQSLASLVLLRIQCGAKWSWAGVVLTTWLLHWAVKWSLIKRDAWRQKCVWVDATHKTRIRSWWNLILATLTVNPPTWVELRWIENVQFPLLDARCTIMTKICKLFVWLYVSLLLSKFFTPLTFLLLNHILEHFVDGPLVDYCVTARCFLPGH